MPANPEQARLLMEASAKDEKPDVVEVFHAAVQAAELHHGLELFGDSALTAITEKPRRGEIKYGRAPVRNLQVPWRWRYAA